MFRYFKYCLQTILNWKTSQNTDLYKLIESIIYSFKIWYFYTSLPLSVNELQHRNVAIFEKELRSKLLNENLYNDWTEYSK